jgi:hypothetical protein
MIHVPQNPRVTHPLQQLDNFTIATQTRFDKVDLAEILHELRLLPDVIIDAGRQKIRKN